MNKHNLSGFSQSGLSRCIVFGLALVVAAVGFSFWPPQHAKAEAAVAIPVPAMDSKAPAGIHAEKAVLAGGCFWGVQGVFQHVKGVSKVVSGYAGGSKETASYETVSSGQTGHAESVEITFDPSVVSYGTILQIYFSVAHDPTELNRQGPDTGTQYRSAIFTNDPDQKQVAETYIAQLDKAGVYPQPIVTRIEPLAGFYPAENYHQDYATLHPENPYIAYNDLPKIDNLSKVFPALYRPQAKLLRMGASASSD